jgi:hypothetical protein
MTQHAQFPVLILTLVLCAGCGGSAPDAEAPASVAARPAPAPARTRADAEKGATALPTACEKGKENPCLPPMQFVKKLCGGLFPDIALVLFAKGSPWTRGYLRMNVEAWNASGGASSSDKLVFDEEVLILSQKTADTGGMQVSGSGGGYDVLRWDGTCASLAGEELTRKVPPKAKHAKIPWKSLDYAVREALEAHATIGKVVGERRKECKGATMGDVSLKCVKADAMLSAAVVDYVRGGGTVPAPSRLP